METEFSQGGVTLRVDGDVLDVMLPGSSTRVPISKLQARLHRMGRTYLLAIGQSMFVDSDGQPLPLGPLHSFGDGAAIGGVGGLKFLINPDNEPSYREFFAGLAPLCDNREVQEPPPEKEKRGLFGRRGK
jgi:hypothetical protein